MIGAIWAQSPTRAIGKGGKIPWRYAGDFKRFKRVTMGATIVMGRKTWESIGRPLPGRQNVVISPTLVNAGRTIEGVQLIDSLSTLLLYARRPSPEGYGDTNDDIWIIGGAQVYADAMPHVAVIDVTYVPDDVPAGPDVVLAPVIDEAVFKPGELLPHTDEPALSRRLYTRRIRA